MIANIRNCLTFFMNRKNVREKIMNFMTKNSIVMMSKSLKAVMMMENIDVYTIHSPTLRSALSPIPATNGGGDVGEGGGP